MAGLLAARALADRYDEVVIVERDGLTPPGAAHGGSTVALLAPVDAAAGGGQGGVMTIE